MTTKGTSRPIVSFPRAMLGLSTFVIGAACAMGSEIESSGRPSAQDDSTTSSETTGVTTSAADNEGTDSGSGHMSDAGGDEDSGDGPQLAALVQEILDRNCSQCHGAGGPAAGGIDYITDLAALVANGKVISEDPENSKLYIRVSTKTMPPGGIEPRPSDDEIETIYDWIVAGAPSGPAPTNCLDQPFISNDDMFLAMRTDTVGLSSGDLPFTRYLTLTHLYNSGVCDDELELYRQAVAKVVNSLSNEPDVAAPVAIDDERTIFRIDLRDYGWDNNPILGDVWEAVAAQNKFAIRFLGGFAEPLRAELQTSLPNQPADSFLQVASRGQLYYQILQIPGTLDSLQQRLAIDVQENINDGRMLRAGIHDSGVSNFNRVFDRHPLAGGHYYYESSDFASDADEANIFLNPLDFVRAGGEMIFSLPNGFQGYAIEAGGIIIAEAPTTVVKDLQQPDSVVRAGISCMSCHQAGIIARDDEFRDHYNENKNDFNAERDIIEEIFDPDEMRAKQAADRAIFAAALEQLGIPITGPEPIITTSLAFEADLDLRRAASELGVTPDRLEDELSGLDVQLDRLDGGKVSRNVFEAVFAESVCVLVPGDDAFPDCLVPN